MKRPPRGLSADEAALWRKVAATVTPLHPPAAKPPAAIVAAPPPVAAPAPPPAKRVRGRVPPPLVPPAPPPPASRPLTSEGLDGSWDRKLARGAIVPDVTIDLHGMTLDTAHARLNGGIAQALAIGARVILLIAGKPRPHGDHDQRGERRGAIRAKLLDWLAHSPHAGQIAAVRAASPRHGGAGAVYIVLRRLR
ncbi:Smr/MutS family protein [Novosphingobium sp. Fuku2-ISO-50]|uniref:Smr/MutS family protein n=1 Tax=Novosphingobium sp. Fuku2-ISO-50 TaxID=1739114 RepID=UPI00076CECE1|nr:Smr/MutS family protein [Novosphingobium sp. Fuku2-ISO-50]KUR78822.1 DNA mismatch repair protein MutS [Novosphingobium sp. Fuku2-ISO-50]